MSNSSTSSNSNGGNPTSLPSSTIMPLTGITNASTVQHVNSSQGVLTSTTITTALSSSLSSASSLLSSSSASLALASSSSSSSSQKQPQNASEWQLYLVLQRANLLAYYD